MLGEGYLILSRHLVHDITKYWPSDIRGGKFVVLDVLRDQPKGRWMNTTTLFPTMSIIYRWNRKLVISTIISYLIHVHRVFNHLTRLFGFSLSSPLRLSVLGQLITHLNLLFRAHKYQFPQFTSSNYYRMFALLKKLFFSILGRFWRLVALWRAEIKTGTIDAENVMYASLVKKI